jgi:DNA-binding transcriptional LysR family regulator
MKILEEEVGFPLIQPSGRGIVITKEGERFAEKGQKILDELGQLSQYAKGVLSNSDQIRLGSFEVFTTYFIGEIYKELSESHDLIVHELGPGKIEEALLERKIDVGISYIAIPHKDLDHLQVGKARMGVYGLKDHFQKIPMSDLPFVIPVEPLVGAPTKAQGSDGWQPSYGPRTVRFKVGMMETALELVRRGLAVAYLPGFVVDLHNLYVQPKYKIEEILFPEDSARNSPVYLIKRKDEKETSLMKKLAKALRKNLM